MSDQESPLIPQDSRQENSQQIQQHQPQEENIFELNKEYQEEQIYQTTEIKNQSRNEEQIDKDQDQEDTQEKNFHFCCKKCKSNLQHNNKTCVCVVPWSQRRVKLTNVGCWVCGCQGCTKEDKDYFSGKTENWERKMFRKRSMDSNESQNSKNKQHYEELGNLDNFQYSSTIQKILQQHQVYASQIGIGIPERTKGYLTGRNPNYSYK